MHQSRPRRAFSMVELLLVLSLLSALSLIAVVSGGPLLSAAAVETATRETVSLFALARDHALASGQRTAVRVDAPRARLVVHAGADTLAAADFSDRAVRLSATRDSMAYAPSGLGVGAANLSVVLARGGRADTVTVSRLGRVDWR